MIIDIKIPIVSAAINLSVMVGPNINRYEARTVSTAKNIAKYIIIEKSHPASVQIIQ